MTDESGVTTFAYDGLGRLTGRASLVNGRTIATSYVWGTSGTATDKVVSITYPSKARVNYSYDAAGRVSSLRVNPPSANGSSTNTGGELPLLSHVVYTPTTR
jgi:YD repeat-containing protein